MDDLKPETQHLLVPKVSPKLTTEDICQKNNDYLRIAGLSNEVKGFLERQLNELNKNFSRNMLPGRKCTHFAQNIQSGRPKVKKMFGCSACGKTCHFKAICPKEDEKGDN